jgi:hypothetical protein
MTETGKRYFRMPIESSNWGDGLYYIEFTEEKATRQVQVFSDRAFATDRSQDEPVLDQRLDKFLEPETPPLSEIASDEFEAVWKQCRSTG